MRILRDLYDWVMKWAESRYALPALFVLAAVESVFFPIPPDVLLIALAISKPTRAYRFALITLAGTVTGGVIGYGIGAAFMDTAGMPILKMYDAMDKFDWLATKYQENAALAVSLAGFTIIPYKVFAISAGACKVDLGVFVIASALSRAARFYLVSFLIVKFGSPIRVWIERYFNIAVTAFAILLLGGFALVKWLL